MGIRARETKWRLLTLRHGVAAAQYLLAESGLARLRNIPHYPADKNGRTSAGQERSRW